MTRYTFHNHDTQSCNGCEPYHHRHCEECGEAFTAWSRRGVTREEWLAKPRRYGLRSDARQCSPACRQKAYRQRKAES